MTERKERKRLDVLMLERGLAESRQKAQAMILAGEVRVAGQPAAKAGEAVSADALIEVSSRLEKYASRGGLKLEGALEDFQVDVHGRTCLDVGASTGGFVDCLLQHGAVRVYAVDVNTRQLAWKLQQDERVIRIERNARELSGDDVPELVDLVVADVSFISLGKVLEPAVRVARAGAEFLVLVKPQFELRREDVGKGGIVSDPALHQRAIASVRAAAQAFGLECMEVQPSKLRGAEGNQEYFLHARKKT